MGSLKESAILGNQTIDVICQHTTDGRLIPLRVRLVDEDGQGHIFTVKGYRDYSKSETYRLPSGMMATSTIFPFEIKINTLGVARTIRVFYNCRDCTWSLVSDAEQREGKGLGQKRN